MSREVVCRFRRREAIILILVPIFILGLVFFIFAHMYETYRYVNFFGLFFLIPVLLIIGKSIIFLSSVFENVIKRNFELLVIEGGGITVISRRFFFAKFYDVNRLSFEDGFFGSRVLVIETSFGRSVQIPSHWMDKEFDVVRRRLLNAPLDSLGPAA